MTIKWRLRIRAPEMEGISMRAAIYVRVSSEEQVDGYSLDAQRRVVSEFCHVRGWEISHRYADEGKSAWSESAAKRPGFNRMLADAGNKAFDVLVTHSFDRFSRNLMVTLNAFHTFSQSGIAYVSATQEIDYSTPEGKLFMTMVAAFAQYFSDNLSGHTRKGMRERARQGLFNGDPPFGYQRCDPTCLRTDDEHPGCHIDAETGPEVLSLFEQYAYGSYSMSTLARALNAKGFRTNGRSRSGDSPDVGEAKGGRFTNWSVRDILENQFYLGKVRHKDEYFDGLHQPLVSQELFDEVQKRKLRNRHRKSATVSRRSKNPHILTGLLHCDGCGAKLWSQHQGRTAGTYYIVPKKGHDDRCAHAGKSIRGQVLEDQADLIFADFTLREDWIDWIIDNYVDQSDLADGIKRREALHQKIERARELYLEGDLSKDRYDLIKSNAEAEIDGVYIPELDDAQDAAMMLQKFNVLWKNAPAGQRNRLLLSILEAIYVDVEERQIVGLRPRQAFLTLFGAVEGNDAVTLSSNLTGNFGRAGGDGGESNSPSRNFPDQMYYKLVRRFDLAATDSRRRDSAAASR